MLRLQDNVQISKTLESCLLVSRVDLYICMYCQVGAQCPPANKILELAQLGNGEMIV